MESEDSDAIDDMDTVRSKRTSYVCFKPLMYCNRHQDMSYYYRYFKPYMFDHRLLTMGHDCGCPVRRLHKTSCSWYDSDTIYMVDTQADLSISEKSAQQQIYKIYMETLNNLPEECGCGTQASISYMGHSTSCDEFKHIHERESHEVLLAILKKRKNCHLVLKLSLILQNKMLMYKSMLMQIELILHRWYPFLVSRKPPLN